MSLVSAASELWQLFIDEFKVFATEGKAVDIALGTIIGAGVTPVANSIVDDIVMPPVGMMLGKADLPNQYLLLSEGKNGGPYKTLKEAQEDGAVTINYGRLANRSISLIVILMVAFAIVKLLNAIRKAQQAEKEKKMAAKRAARAFARVAAIEAQKNVESKSQIDPNTIVRQAKSYEDLKSLAQTN